MKAALGKVHEERAGSLVLHASREQNSGHTSLSGHWACWWVSVGWSRLLGSMQE